MKSVSFGVSSSKHAQYAYGLCVQNSTWTRAFACYLYRVGRPRPAYNPPPSCELAARNSSLLSKGERPKAKTHSQGEKSPVREVGSTFRSRRTQARYIRTYPSPSAAWCGGYDTRFGRAPMPNSRTPLRDPIRFAAARTFYFDRLN
jgi:hypothetical protein